MSTFRILPVTMLMATGMLGVKLFDIVQGGQALSNAILVAEATAQDTAKPAETKSEAAEATAKGENAESKTDEKPEEKKEPGKKEPGKPITPSPVSDTPPDTVKLAPQNFTQNEIDLLQNLSKRREQLEQWSKELELKENVLTATEQRIDQKLSDMQSLKKQVDALLVTYNQHEDGKIKSLVKIYENMKPGDAAGIFEQTDMPVLLLLIDKMSERKVAPILAAMNPKKAKDITAELAAQRRVQQIPANTDAMPETPKAKPPAPAAPQPAAPAADTAAPNAGKPAELPAAGSEAAAPAPAEPKKP